MKARWRIWLLQLGLMLGSGLAGAGIYHVYLNGLPMVAEPEAEAETEESSLIIDHVQSVRVLEGLQLAAQGGMLEGVCRGSKIPTAYARYPSSREESIVVYVIVRHKTKDRIVAYELSDITWLPVTNSATLARAP